MTGSPFISLPSLEPQRLNMDAPNPQHKFNIWNLADSQNWGSRSSAVDTGGRLAPARPFADRQRRSLRDPEARATTHPFRGRCVLPSNIKVSCTTIKVQPEWIDLAYNTKDPSFDVLSLDTRIGLELDYFGQIHGALFRKASEGFSISPESAYHDLLVDKLAELRAAAARFEGERSNLDRLTARITLRNPHCVYRLVDADQTIYRAKIVMLSHKLATLRSARIQRAGTRLLLSSTPNCGASVLRTFETGFTVEFDVMLEDLNEDLTFG
jgi:hypothetical protein